MTGDGGIVFTDSGNERIRRIDPDGTIATLAGDGRKCPSPTDRCGDGGPALTAQLNVPHDVAVLLDGAILIADTFDHRIRRVAPDGTITTVAGTGQRCAVGPDPCGRGGPATAGRLALPASLHPLPGGGFMFADQATSRVRAVHLGTLLELAGGGMPGYEGDGGPALDARFNSLADAEPLPGGGFLVADGLNCRLRRVTADGTLIPVRGRGAARGLRHARRGGRPPRSATAGRRCRPGSGCRVTSAGRRRQRLLCGHLRQPDPPHRAGRPHRHRRGERASPWVTAATAARRSRRGSGWPSGVALRPAGGLLFTDSGDH